MEKLCNPAPASWRFVMFVALRRVLFPIIHSTSQRKHMSQDPTFGEPTAYQSFWKRARIASKSAISRCRRFSSISQALMYCISYFTKHLLSFQLLSAFSLNIGAFLNLFQCKHLNWPPWKQSWQSLFQQASEYLQSFESSPAHPSCWSPLQDSEHLILEFVQGICARWHTPAR